MDNSAEAQAISRLMAYQSTLDEASARGLPEYVRAFTSSPHGIGAHEIDVDKKLVRVNAEELRILGYAEKEMLGRLVFDFVVMNEVSKRAVDRKLSGATELKPFVRAFRRRDGSAVTLLLLDRHIHGPGGRILGIRTALTEIDTLALALDRKA